MRVLLVTWTDQLSQKLSILNPQLEYCAIVVDEVEPAQKILEQFGLPKTLIHPLYELKECVRDFYYDYVICVESNFYDEKIMSAVKTYDVPKDKLLSFAALSSEEIFKTERTLRYFKEHATEFEMFATGISYTQVALDVTRFKHKLFNFGQSSQDLYYNFQVAKHAVTWGGGILRYALIGLSPYSFHYDLSKSKTLEYVILQYLIAFNDLHNFFVPADVYRQFFRKEYLTARLPLEPFNYGAHPLNKRMDQKKRLVPDKAADSWAERNFLETRAENIQIFDDYLTLCEQNNIRPIIFLPTMTDVLINHYNKQKIDEFRYLVRQACKKHSSAIFIDGWQLRGLTDSDFYDNAHLNSVGAAKFSAFLNHCIEQLDGKR